VVGVDLPDELLNDFAVLARLVNSAPVDIEAIAIA